jgi:hypothetical protein
MRYSCTMNVLPSGCRRSRVHETSANTSNDRMRCAQRRPERAPTSNGGRCVVRHRNNAEQRAIKSRVVEARLAGSNLRSLSEVMAGRAAGSGVFCLLMHFRHRLFLAHVTPRRRHQHPVFSYPSCHCCSHCPSFPKILGSLLSSCPAMRRVRHEPSLTERGQT